jgi:hypothetical protein
MYKALLVLLVFTSTCLTVHAAEPTPPSDYRLEWKQIATLERKAQPEEAMKLAVQLYARAKAEDNQPQMLRSLLCILRYNIPIQKEEVAINMHLLKQEADAAPFPLQPILQSKFATELLKILDHRGSHAPVREPGDENSLAKIPKWTTDTLWSVARAYLMQSVQPREALTAVDLSTWNDALLQVPGSKHFRPTLYDLLAWRAIYFLENNFVLNDAAKEKSPHLQFLVDRACFSSAPVFAIHNFPDTIAPAALGDMLDLYQNLTKVHLKDSQPDALIAIELERLKFANLHVRRANTDSLYYRALLDLEQDYAAQDTGLLVSAHIAQILDTYGKAFWDWVGITSHNHLQAIENTCRRGLSRHPKAMRARDLQHWLDEVNQPVVSLYTKRSLVPMRPIPVIISYKNTDHIWLRIVKKPEKLTKKDYDKARYLNLVRLPSLLDTLVMLPASADKLIQDHTVNLRGLPPGEYCIMGSISSRFQEEESIVHGDPIVVASFDWVSRRTADNGSDLLIVDRESGKPVPNVKATLSKDSKSRRRPQDFVTDSNGILTFPPAVTIAQDNQDGWCRLQRRDESLTFKEYHFFRGDRENRSREDTTTLLFTDRKLYRPGQKVHFKGIVVREDSLHRLQVLKGFTTHVRLRAYRDTLFQAKVTTNGFGAYSGTIQLPERKLPGSYFIADAFGRRDIRIEEYRRPQFEMNMAPDDSTYVFGEKIVLGGTAMRYSGAPVGRATVRYQVFRKIESKRDAGWRRRNYGATEYHHLVHAGEVQTEMDGRFEWAYIPQLDPWEDETSTSYHDYQVSVAVTDASGETVKTIVMRKVLPSRPATMKKKDEWNFPKVLWTTHENTRIQPRDTASFQIETSLDSAWVLYEWESSRRIVRQEWLQVTGGSRKVSFPYLEEYSDGITVHLTLYADGKFHSNTLEIRTPAHQRELTIHPATFRNRIVPGAPEEWTLRIRSNGGEPIAAELLACMYDASLDAIARNEWVGYPYATQGPARQWIDEKLVHEWGEFNLSPYLYHQPFNQEYDLLDWMGYDVYDDQWQYSGLEPVASGHRAIDRAASGGKANFSNPFRPLRWIGRILGFPSKFKNLPPRRGVRTLYIEDIEGGDENVTYGMTSPQYDRDTKTNDLTLDSISPPQPHGLQQQGFVRTNLQETAFFFPDLHTDDQGDIILKFTSPEALTRWRLMAFAHTDDMRSGYHEAFVVTQKPLMIVPSPPRFVREGDSLVYRATVSNLSGKDQQGEARLSLYDAQTRNPLDTAFQMLQPVRTFTVKQGESIPIQWSLKIPEGVEAVTHRVIAETADFRDGEENILPVLPRKVPVLEALSLPLKPHERRVFTFSPLLAATDKDLQQGRLTLQFTPNPTWQVILALPYMMEFPYECAEQTFSRYYANALAAHVDREALERVALERVASGHSAIDSAPPAQFAFLSTLEQNQELKDLLLAETPWLHDAQDENLQRQRLAMLFDPTRLAAQQKAMAIKLKAMAVGDQFTWFPGTRANRHLGQHIIAGFGHLSHLGINSWRDEAGLNTLVNQGVRHLDKELEEEFRQLKKDSADLDLPQLTPIQIHALYARSFFPKVDNGLNGKPGMRFFLDQAQTYWTRVNPYLQGMIALVMHRTGEQKTAKEILESLKNQAIHHPEEGMHWQMEGDGRYWHQAPIEAQALLIEAFHEIAQDTASVRAMQLWLLRQKQVQQWTSTRATADACYALLLNSPSLSTPSLLPDIRMGGEQLTVQQSNETGFLQKTWDAPAVTPAMGTIEITNPNPTPAWGAVYWQYFQDPVQSVPAGNAHLKVEKTLLKEENAVEASRMIPEDHPGVASGTSFHPGELVTVRITIHTDRDLEYVHLKDMRAAGFEPIDLLSGYKWQDGLGYYQSTRDAATHFFFDWLPKGVYVFEYPLRATHTGDFSNGITTIQCMYAPEFTAHTEGIRVRIQAGPAPTRPLPSP